MFTTVFFCQEHLVWHYCMMVHHMDSGAQILLVLPLANCLNTDKLLPLCYSLVICKMGIIMVPLRVVEIKWVIKCKVFWRTSHTFDFYLKTKTKILISWVSKDLPSLINVQPFPLKDTFWKNKVKSWLSYKLKINAIKDFIISLINEGTSSKMFKTVQRRLSRNHAYIGIKIVISP